MFFQFLLSLVERQNIFFLFAYYSGYHLLKQKLIRNSSNNSLTSFSFQFTEEINVGCNGILLYMLSVVITSGLKVCVCSCCSFILYVCMYT